MIAALSGNGDFYIPVIALRYLARELMRYGNQEVPTKAKLTNIDVETMPKRIVTGTKNRVVVACKTFSFP